MRPGGCGSTSKVGRKYAYYSCPRHLDGACENSRHFPERALRDVVTARLRARLFPPPEHLGEVPAWLPKLMNQVQHELGRYQDGQPGRMVAIEQELAELGQKLAGWCMTLGNPQLSPVVRAGIQDCYEKAALRQEELQQIVASSLALEKQVEQTLNPQIVINHLHRLNDALATHNPTRGNLELSHHIERIDCFPDGHVAMRGTLVGLFEGVVQLLSRDDHYPHQDPDPQPSQQHKPVAPRRRGRLRIPDLTADSDAMVGDVDTSLDPLRFVGLPETFFWTETFLVPKKLSWAEEHAEEVHQARLATGLSCKKLTTRFGKSAPTLQKACRIAVARRQGSDTPQDTPV